MCIKCRAIPSLGRGSLTDSYHEMPTMGIITLQRENSTQTNEIMLPVDSIIRPLLLSSSYIVGLNGNSNLAKSYYLKKKERRERTKKGAAIEY